MIDEKTPCDQKFFQKINSYQENAIQEYKRLVLQFVTKLQKENDNLKKGIANIEDVLPYCSKEIIAEGRRKAQKMIKTIFNLSDKNIKQICDQSVEQLFKNSSLRVKH